MQILKFGSRGTKVRSLQNKLMQLNFTISRFGADGYYGPETENAVKAFQRSVNILEDGVVGDDTLAMINLALNPNGPPAATSPAKTDLRLPQLVVQKALSQVGIRETPANSNRGADVEKYLASIGLGGGYAWCMAFVYWCIKEAAKELNLPHPLYKTGGVLMQWSQRPQLRTQNPAPGYIFIIDHGRGRGHAGIVETVTDAAINTIEGNSNIEGSREGDGVYRRTRELSSINKGYLRL